MRIFPVLLVVVGVVLGSCLPSEDVPPTEPPDENGDGLGVPVAGGVVDESVALSAGFANGGASLPEEPEQEEVSAVGDAAWTGVEWVLAGLAGDEVVDRVTTTFSVNAEGQATGLGGVNRYGGTFAVDGEGGIQAGPFASTRMAGPPEAMRQEHEFLTLLGKAVAVEVVGGELRIECEGKAEPLRFKRADPES